MKIISPIATHKLELSKNELEELLDSMIYGMMQVQENIELGDMSTAISHIVYKVLSPMDEIGLSPFELQAYYEAHFHTL
jgi:hypothetical protein